jgi:hypothetical protein
MNNYNFEHIKEIASSLLKVSPDNLSWSFGCCSRQTNGEYDSLAENRLFNNSRFDDEHNVLITSGDVLYYCFDVVSDDSVYPVLDKTFSLSDVNFHSLITINNFFCFDLLFAKSFVQVNYIRFCLK